MPLFEMIHVLASSLWRLFDASEVLLLAPGSTHLTHLVLLGRARLAAKHGTDPQKESGSERGRVFHGDAFEGAK